MKSVEQLRVAHWPSLERFIPATNSFVPAGGIEARRNRHTATRLQE